MGAKYFTANTTEAATALACSFFKCDETALTIETVSAQGASPDGATAESITILAIEGSSESAAHMDGSYKLYYEPEGVFLEIYPRRGSGKGIDSNELIFHIKRKKINALGIAAVQQLVEKGSGRTKIAAQQEEYTYGEDMTVTISGDEREVFAKLMRPEPGGAELTPDDARRILSESGVAHGINHEEVESFLLLKNYDEPHLVATATPPVDGEDAKLIFHFSTEERTGRPKEIDVSGRVDYRSLDLYVPVTENQLLVTKTLATEGKDGMTVKGNIIKAKPGKDIALPRGKNVLFNDEKTEMHSAVSGFVEYVNGMLNVSNVYSVKGDCDISTGNIDFEGSVQISGSVRNGSQIKATDGIYIGGSVEAAVLIAGGNVEVKGGMQGADKGRIEAGGTVSIMFVERGKILSDGPITVDVSIHSHLETSGMIYALGKRGAIIGGTANAGEDIITNYIGALSGTKTSVGVGFLPRKRKRIEELEKELMKLETDKTKLAQLDAYLEKTKGTGNKETWDKLHISGIENKKINAEAMTRVKSDIERLKAEMQNAINHRVHVFETAFNGSSISIGSATYIVSDDVSFATFKYKDGDVIYGSCEKNKADYK